MRRCATLFVALLVAALAVPAPAAALEEAISDLVLIQAGEVIEGDLLAGGNRVQVSGTINGDLIATAFDEVHISGVVEGDLLALSPRVVVEGRVLGSVRVLAAEVEIRGQVTDDVLVVGRSLAVDGLIGKDVFAALWDARISGIVNGSVRINAAEATVDGGVAGDVEGSMRHLTIPADGRVRGDVVVRGDLDLEDPASVSGAARTPEPRQLLRVRSVALLGWLVAIGTWLAAGPILHWAAPRWLKGRLGAARRPSSFLRGLGAFVVLGLTVMVMWLFASLSPPEVAVALGALAFLLGLAGLVLLAVVALVGIVPVTMQVGTALGAPSGEPAAHARGALAILLVSLVPWVGDAVVGLMAVHAIGVVVPSRRLRGEDGDEQRGGREPRREQDPAPEDGSVDMPLGPGTEGEPDEGGDDEERRPGD